MAAPPAARGSGSGGSDRQRRSKSTQARSLASVTPSRTR
jgi:hypothetical protein